MNGGRITTAQAFSAVAARIKRSMRTHAASADLCQDSLAVHMGVSQQLVSRWMSSTRDDTPHLARFALAPRDWVLAVARDLLAEHHAVVVDLLGHDPEHDGPDIFAELDAAQQGIAKVMHASFAAIADRVVSRREATEVRAAIRSEIEALMSLDRRMERIEKNGDEGIGGTH